jgi:hypothetical protein
MKNKKTDANLWSYLDAIGVLENGTDAEIKTAKRAYWKNYYTRYRRNQREEKPEYNVSLSRKNGEYGKVALAAKRHKMTVTEFLRKATLAYLDKTFLILNPDQVARIEQHLMNCVNEISAITHTKEKHHWEREQKFDAIAERIGKLEMEIKSMLCFPNEITNDRKN